MAGQAEDTKSEAPPVERVQCLCAPENPQWEYIGLEAYRCQRCGFVSQDQEW